MHRFVLYNYYLYIINVYAHHKFGDFGFPVFHKEKKSEKRVSVCARPLKH